MIFQFGWKPVPIQRILICFEAILPSFYFSASPSDFWRRFAAEIFFLLQNLQVPKILHHPWLGDTKQRQEGYQLFKLMFHNNGFIITWILHQLSMYSNRVKLVAGWIIIPQSTLFTPFPTLPLVEQTDQ